MTSIRVTFRRTKGGVLLALARIRCQGAVAWASLSLPAGATLTEAYALAARLALERCPEDGPAEVQGWLLDHAACPADEEGEA